VVPTTIANEYFLIEYRRRPATGLETFCSTASLFIAAAEIPPASADYSHSRDATRGDAGGAVN
jgi:hypothetical protein